MSYFAATEVCTLVRPVTIRQVGGSVSATLPKEMAARLRLAPDDKIFAVETEDGILLTPYDSETQKQLAIAAKVAKKHRAVFRQLAK